jgi:hypothetical protein
MTARDVQVGTRLQIHSQQVQGYYHHPEGKSRQFAVPGVYRVERREELGNNVTVIHLRSDVSGDLFECSLYHLAAILGQWSRVE